MLLLIGSTGPSTKRKLAGGLREHIPVSPPVLIGCAPVQHSSSGLSVERKPAGLAEVVPLCRLAYVCADCCHTGLYCSSTTSSLSTKREPAGYGSFGVSSHEKR